MGFLVISIFAVVVLQGIVSGSSGAALTTAKAVVITPQTLNNFTYELQNDWKYSWEQCDEELYPLQSPIKIDGYTEMCPEGESINVWFEARDTDYKLQEDSLSVEYRYSILNLKQNNLLLVYQSSSIHFHNHGEHTVNGTTGDLQVHINYKLLSGKSQYQLLILAVPILVNTEQMNNSRQFLTLFSREYSHVVNFGEFFSLLKTSGFYKYRGSMTTPPCLGGVTWLVADSTLTIPQGDLVFWRLLINEGKANNKKVAAQNGRTVTYMPAACRSSEVEVDLVLGAVRIISISLVISLLL